MNILYVENHRRFAAIAVKMFLAEHTVTVVPSVAGAREELARNRFDLVLLDHDLDDGKGAELVSQLEAQSDRPLILAVSSHAAGNEALLQAGADGVCGKREFARVGAVITGLNQARRADGAFLRSASNSRRGNPQSP